MMFFLASGIEYYATATATATGFVGLLGTKVLGRSDSKLGAGKGGGKVIEGQRAQKVPTHS